MVSTGSSGPGGAFSPVPSLAPRPAIRRRPRPPWPLVEAGLGLVVLTAAMVLLRGRMDLDSVLLLYLLAVVVIALKVGRVAGLAAGVVSYLLALYLFVPPIGEFDLDSPHHLAELSVFLIVALLVGVGADAAARHRRQLAEQVARNRQLAELEGVRRGLLTAVSHDLRTPLADIKANAAALKYVDPTWSQDIRFELLTSIEDAADQLADMVSSLLDLSRIRAGALRADLTKLSLHEVVHRALVTAGDGRTSVDVPEDMPLVWADSSLLERVIANLVINAHQHAPDGLPVLVRAEQVASGVRVSVVDHGSGIAEERWDEVFQSFQRLGDHGAGIGLGLAIARGFCQAMGTTLTPSQTPGGGLTMSLELAAAP